MMQHEQISLHAGETVRFAKAELRKYLGQMGIPPQSADRVVFKPFSADDSLYPADTLWDDAYRIELSRGEGKIEYSNERSALFAVYRILTEMGCRFLHPGKHGAYIPKDVDWEAVAVHVESAAANRHRGVCIEGGNSLENVLDMIDFLPKAGYNAYFTQFMECYTFFERWYTHRGNPLVPPEPFTADMALSMQAEAVRAVKQRGLIYHAVGHGWTCEPLGIPGRQWEAVDITLTDKQKSFMAEVSGKRGLWRGIPLNTNLCYSNPEVRRVVASYIADYAAEHPEIDVLHVWLADSHNNQCECEACIARRPSDFYVEMLLELDALLTERGSPTKIAFLLYFDLMYPPVVADALPADRFLLMYAPITRSFSASFRDVKPSDTLPPYQRNELIFGPDIAENLGYLKAWQACFDGDSFDYDYHLCAAPFYNPGHMTVCKTLYEDIEAYGTLGLGGLVNCQLQRMHIPHGFGVYLAGHALWEPSLDTCALKKDYFAHMFGTENADWVIKYLEQLSDIFPMDYMGQDHPKPDSLIASQLNAAYETLMRISWPDLSARTEEQRLALDRLYLYHQLMMLLADYLRFFAAGNRENAKSAWTALKAYAWTHEPQMQDGFDTYCFVEHFRRQQAEVL